jgi:nitroimidazol reductase NimA-like FMN-containing flavoprotein (pyridoxamine 5'-phosphate oxidase superfamily)
MTRRVLEELSADECFTLIEQETVGRLVYVDDLGPAAVPVNYALAGHGIVFRSEAGSKIAALREHDVAFEVDHIDGISHSGWSVLVRGTSEEVEFEHLHELLSRIDRGYVPLPWKKGIHKIWVVITPKVITGRRLADFADEDFF